MPITIGELVDVPSPLSLLASPWAQDVSERVVHRFGSTAELATWNYAPDGSVAYVTGATQALYVRKSGAWVTVLPASTTTAWVNATMTGTWVNFGGGNQVAQYRMVADIVYIRGLIKSGTLGSTAFTLPVGFRPPANVRVPISSALGTAGGLPYVAVSPAGAVSAGDMASNANVSIDGVQFSTLA